MYIFLSDVTISHSNHASVIQFYKWSRTLKCKGITDHNWLLPISMQRLQERKKENKIETKNEYKQTVLTVNPMTLAMRVHCSLFILYL